MYWRRATAKAAWITVAFGLLFFFIIPILLPVLNGGMKNSEKWTATSYFVETTSDRNASPADVRIRNVKIEQWEKKHGAISEESHEALRAARLEVLGGKPDPLVKGEAFAATKRSGGVALFWTGKVQPAINSQIASLELQIQSAPKEQVNGLKTELAGLLIKSGELKENVEVPGLSGGNVVAKQYKKDVPLVAGGRFRLDMVLYDKFGVELATKNSAAIKTLDLPFAIIAPFLVMIVASLLTQPNNREALDRFYVKMKTPVKPDPEEDAAEMEKSYANPDRFDDTRLLPKSQLEFTKLSRQDWIGFTVCFAICFAIIGLVLLMARIGA
jgi:SSS family solute:Na+ symporter